MDTIYNYNNYEIILKKCVDSVYVQFLDTQLFRIYSNTYRDIDIIKITMGNLDMFHKVLSTVFESLTNGNNDKASLEIFPSMKSLKLSIHHRFYLEFIFELHLDLIQDKSLNAKDMCIKKLEKTVCELSKKHEELNTFINEYMEVTITDIFACGHQTSLSYHIKINTPIIKIKGSGLNCQNIMVDNIYVLITDGPVKYNKNFKIINCHKLIIDNSNNHGGVKDYNFGYNNLPLSITTLVIIGYIGVNNFKQMDLPNIETIEFENCPEIENIYASLSHLKSLKNITIKNCPKFQERDLLLTHGYNFKAV